MKSRILKYSHNALLNVKGAFLLWLSFGWTLMQEANRFRWYHWLILFAGVVRVMQIPGGQEIVYKMSDLGCNCQTYHYNDLWYYVWAGIMEAALLYSMAKALKSYIFSYFALLAAFKVLDQFTALAFTFNPAEIVYWVIALCIVWGVWRKRQ